MSTHPLLGTRLPIIQAPMAGVQDSRLALAVCRAGALGSVPAAMLGPDALRAELQTMVEHSAGPWNVNFFCHANPEPDDHREQDWRSALTPYYQELGLNIGDVQAGAGRRPFDAATLEILREFRPPVVSFHFGLPAPELVAELKRWGTVILSTATTVAEAVWLEAHGADAVIAQGLEAGGHRGMFLSDDITSQMGTFALLPQVAAAVRVPVIAAGGIADSAGISAAMALGAAAVQLGTAFLLCPEAATSQLHRAALASESAVHTALTNVFSGRPARGIVNRVMRELGPMSAVAPAFPQAGVALAPLRKAAEARGSSDFSPLWSGQNACGCQAIAAELLVRRLAGEPD